MHNALVHTEIPAGDGSVTYVFDIEAIDEVVCLNVSVAGVLVDGFTCDPIGHNGMGALKDCLTDPDHGAVTLTGDRVDIMFAVAGEKYEALMDEYNKEVTMQVRLDYTPSWTALVRPNKRWNGWLQPRFTRAEAEKIVAYFTSSQNDEDTLLSWDGDVIVHTTPAYEGEEPVRSEPDRDGLYMIGDGWCWWDAADEDEKPTAVFVNGNMLAHYKDGEIVRWEFTPADEAHGVASLWDGPEIGDLDDVTGPFWTAVQNSLAAGKQSDEFGTAFTVDWTE